MNTHLTFADHVLDRLKPFMFQEAPLLHGSPAIESNKGNAQYAYGERLAALFGTCIVVEWASTEYVHFSVFPTCSFACNVSKVTVVGVREGRFQMSMKLIDLADQEAIEELYNKIGI